MRIRIQYYNDIQESLAPHWSFMNRLRDHSLEFYRTIQRSPYSYMTPD